MDRHKAEINLAALLDGEMRDPAQVAEINAVLERDPQLRAEFEAQRAVKAALGAITPSAQELERRTPDFMATRIMGEIAARRKAPATGRWRPLVGWLGSATALLVGFFTTVQFLQPALNSAAMTAQSQAVGTQFAAAPQSAEAVPAGLTMNVHYAPDYWNKLSVPAGTDQRVADFLKFANEAHNYRRLMHSGDGTAPDMAQAVMAVNSGGTNVVWASDDK